MFSVQSSEVSGVRNLHSMTPIISFVNDRGLQKIQKGFDCRYARENLEDDCDDHEHILRVLHVGFKVQKVFDCRYSRENLDYNCEDYEDILKVSPVGFKGFGNQVCCGRGITEISHEVRQPGCAFSGKLHIILTEEDISSSFETVYTSC